MARLFRACDASDRDAVFALFERVRAVHPEFTPTPAWWAWYFEEAAAGSRSFVALDGDRVVAAVGGRAQRVWSGGAERDFVHVGLVAVEPNLEQALAKEGALLGTLRSMGEAFGSREEAPVFYRHSDTRGWKLLRQRLAWEVVRTESVLLLPTAGCDADEPAGIGRIERFDEQARWLYERCSGEWGASTIRDAQHLNQRFVDVPHLHYTRFGVRDDEGILRGYAIARPLERDGKQVLAIADWLVPPAEAEVGEGLFRATVAEARRLDCAFLAAMFPDFSPWFERFQEWGFQVHPEGHALATRNFDKRLDQMWLNEGWWIQPGDSGLA